MMDKNSRILIAGCETVAGQSLSKLLNEKGYSFSPIPTHFLLDFNQTCEIFEHEKPEYVFLVAGKSAGIQANQSYPAALMRNNLLPELQVFEASQHFQVKKVLFLASSCIYPKKAAVPFEPESLGTGSLESTCEAYALAKLSGITLAQAYAQQYGLKTLAAIPSDTFGPESDFDGENSHVVEAMIRKFHEAKESQAEKIILWGSGKPVRDFLYAQDLAEACLFLMEREIHGLTLNISAGNAFTIQQLADQIKEIVGFTGTLSWDLSKPDGASLKTLNSDPIRKLGWKPQTSFKDALERTYAGFLSKEKKEVHV